MSMPTFSVSSHEGQHFLFIPGELSICVCVCVYKCYVELDSHLWDVYF